MTRKNIHRMKEIIRFSVSEFNIVVWLKFPLAFRFRFVAFQWKALEKRNVKDFMCYKLRVYNEIRNWMQVWGFRFDSASHIRRNYRWRNLNSTSIEIFTSKFVMRVEANTGVCKLNWIRHSQHKSFIDLTQTSWK